MSKIFKVEEVTSEKIGTLRRLAREGRPVTEAVELLGYRGQPESFIAMARSAWNIRFNLSTRQTKSGYGGVLS